MRPRARLCGVLAGIVTASLLSAPTAGAAETAPGDVVELPISFAVKNTNRTSVLCASDGKDYSVRGVIVGPRQALADGNPATLYLHAVTWTSDYFNLDIPGHNFVHALAERGDVSIAVDRLGYGTSDRPPGLNTCLGSEADVAGQMVDALKSGHYAVAGAKPAAFGKVFLGGASVGGLIANITAFSFHNVDGVMNQGFGDFAASPYAGQEVYDANSRCFAGGDPGAPEDYATFAKDTRDTFYFYDADAATRAAVPASSADPCGQIESLAAAIGADTALLAGINVPVLLAYGQNDAVFPYPAMDQEAARYAGSPKVNVFAIPGASHFPILETFVDVLIGATHQWLKNNTPRRR